MKNLQDLLARNHEWSAALRARDPGFFRRLSEQQAPKYLWIGCSDSRVPANQIIDMAPGEVFVHRNVANVVAHTDFNALSTLQFAVDVLRVEHVIVVGHYGCGGVRAVLEKQRLGLVDNGLERLQPARGALAAEALGAALGAVAQRAPRQRGELGDGPGDFGRDRQLDQPGRRQPDQMGVELAREPDRGPRALFARRILVEVHEDAAVAHGGPFA